MQIARDKLDEAARILGLSFADFENMTTPVLNKALKEAFNKVAQERHPDRGGDGEAWLAVVRARDLIRTYLGGC